MYKNTGLRDSDLQEIMAVLKRFPTLGTATLFGSRAKGTHKPGSDVDLSVQGNDLTFDQLRDIRHALNEETLMPYHFDIVHLESIQSPELIEHIHRVGIQIYPL